MSTAAVGPMFPTMSLAAPPPPPPPEPATEPGAVYTDTLAQGDPPPPPGAGAVALRSGYGPARMAPERYAPFASNPGAPPPPGGGTAPMPIRAGIPPQSAPARNSLPVRKTEKQKPKKKRPATAHELDELEVETGGGGPPSAPCAGAARIRVGKRGLPDDAAVGPGY